MTPSVSAMEAALREAIEVVEGNARRSPFVAVEDWKRALDSFASRPVEAAAVAWGVENGLGVLCSVGMLDDKDTLEAEAKSYNAGGWSTKPYRVVPLYATPRAAARRVVEAARKWVAARDSLERAKGPANMGFPGVMADAMTALQEAEDEIRAALESPHA